MAAQPDPDLIRARLLELRRQLTELEATGHAAAQTVELDQTRVGRLSRMDALQSQAMSQASNNRRAAELVAIEAALQRLEQGQYGECIDCGELINPRRLELNPVVRRCVACAAEIE